MRDFYDDILAFIVATSLTDEEFEACTATIPIYDQSTYDDMTRVLQSRGGVSTYQDRLNAYYTAKGVSYSQAVVANSNIFIGAVL